MPGHDEQVERYEKQVHELQTQVKFLEEEVGLLRRRLTNAPRQVTLLEEKLVETRDQLTRAMGQNQKLADALRGEREKIEALAEEVEKLSQPPASFGVYLGTNEDGSIDVFTGGRKMRVTPAPDLDLSKFRPGVAGDPQRLAERRRGPGPRSSGRGRQGEGSPRRRTGSSWWVAATRSSWPPSPAA